MGDGGGGVQHQDQPLMACKAVNSKSLERTGWLSPILGTIGLQETGDCLNNLEERIWGREIQEERRAEGGKGSGRMLGTVRCWPPHSGKDF